MGRSSILGADRAPTQAAGRDTDALGPSDTSDSGSDIQGEPFLYESSPEDERLGAARTDHSSDSDAAGTGERHSALPDEDVRDGADILPDRIGRFSGSGSDEDDLSLDDETLAELEAEEPLDEEESSTDR